MKEEDDFSMSLFKSRDAEGDVADERRRMRDCNLPPLAVSFSLSFSCNDFGSLLSSSLLLCFEFPLMFLFFCWLIGKVG